MSVAGCLGEREDHLSILPQNLQSLDSLRERDLSSRGGSKTGIALVTRSDPSRPRDSQSSHAEKTTQATRWGARNRSSSRSGAARACRSSGSNLSRWRNPARSLRPRRSNRASSSSRSPARSARRLSPRRAPFPPHPARGGVLWLWTDRVALWSRGFSRALVDRGQISQEFGTSRLEIGVDMI